MQPMILQMLNPTHTAVSDEPNQGIDDDQTLDWSVRAFGDVPLTPD